MNQFFRTRNFVEPRETFLGLATPWATSMHPPTEAQRSQATETLSDEELVLRVRGGEVALFELLMRRNNQRIFRAARAILRDDHEAEDVMQQAYVRAYEHLHEFEARARFSTWLTRIAVHEALARVRRQRRFAPLPEQTLPGAHNPEQETSDVEMRRVLESAVDELPDDFRTVFVLRSIEGMSGAETAECLGIPEETVKTRLFRARSRLREILLASIEPTLPEVYDFHLSRCNRVVAAVLSQLGISLCRRDDRAEQ